MRNILHRIKALFFLSYIQQSDGVKKEIIVGRHVAHLRLHPRGVTKQRSRLSPRYERLGFNY